MTPSGKPAVELFRWGLTTLMGMCDHISEQAQANITEDEVMVE